MRSVPLRVLIALVALVALVFGITHRLGEPGRRAARYAALAEQHRQWVTVDGQQVACYTPDDRVEWHYKLLEKYTTACQRPMEPVPEDGPEPPVPPEGDVWREGVRRMWARVREDEQNRKPGDMIVTPLRGSVK